MVKSLSLLLTDTNLVARAVPQRPWPRSNALSVGNRLAFRDTRTASWLQRDIHPNGGARSPCARNPFARPTPAGGGPNGAVATGNGVFYAATPGNTGDGTGWLVGSALAALVAFRRRRRA